LVKLLLASIQATNPDSPEAKDAAVPPEEVGLVLLKRVHG